MNNKRPLIYICSPFLGEVEMNLTNARRYSRFAFKKGYTPIAPHLLFPQFMDDGNVEERRTAMEMDVSLLSLCSELWVFGDRISEGMSIEIKHAKETNIPIRYFNNNCEVKER